MNEQTNNEVQELSLEEAAQVKGGGFWSWLFGGSSNQYVYGKSKGGGSNYA
ncbi:MAG TPA: hypothetical protein V6D05_16960 [Stenomitos sp.]